MKITYLYYAIICLLFYSCAIKAQKNNNINEECTISEESFETTSMRKFLNTTTNGRDIIDKFIHDTSSYSILSVENDNVLYAFLKDGIWNIYYDKQNYTIKDENLSSDLDFYANKNIVYKVKCPDDFVIYDSNESLKAIWIKKSSNIKFLYYSIKCETVCLNNDEKKKIEVLKNIVKKLTID